MKKIIKGILLLIIIAVGVNFALNNGLKLNYSGAAGMLNLNNSNISNATEDTLNTLVLVNRQNSLSKEYIPSELVEADVPFRYSASSEERMMRKEAADALKKMFTAAKESGINLCGVSGYRSYESQESLYNEKLNSLGRDYVDSYVAYPGQSEHQTGLAMDVGIQGVNSYDFGKSQEGKWVDNNARYYGFVIRYPKEKQDITGCAYEPWHVRYVGKTVALTMKSQNLVLEEYLKR